MKIFLCSTFEDLRQYRRAAMEVLLECGDIYKGMEFFGSTEHDALSTCLENVRQADRLIVLLGTRYGSRPKPNAVSFTELEVNEAEKLRIPIHAYFLDVEKQPILARFVDAGEDGDALLAFKARLAKQYTVDKFTSPDDLARRLARDLLREERRNRHGDKDRSAAASVIHRYRETAYDALAEWYDVWYKDHWSSEEPFHTLEAIIRSYREASHGNVGKIRLLDCACGTGNTFVAFTRHGYEIYGTDGSREMLLRAEGNCLSVGVSTDRLILDPINWTDEAAYKEQFGEGSFDVIVNTANSLCHIPPVPEYMGVALRNFSRLLKPGGLLFVDTKRYIRSDPEDGVETYRELRYVAGVQEWLVRSERHEAHDVPGFGEVHFHTRLLYDDDPSFSTKVRRALIVVTIYGGSVTPRVLVVPYYPLPARLLANQMTTCGFSATILPAMEKFASKWKYDIVVGQKQEQE